MGIDNIEVLFPDDKPEDYTRRDSPGAGPRPNPGEPKPISKLTGDEIKEKEANNPE